MASISEVGNDTRGWILCVISAIGKAVVVDFCTLSDIVL